MTKEVILEHISRIIGQKLDIGYKINGFGQRNKDCINEIYIKLKEELNESSKKR